MKCRVWILFAALVPVVGSAAWLMRGGEIIQVADPAPSSLITKGWQRVELTTNTAVVTNVVLRDAKLAAAEAKYIAALATIGANPATADIDAQSDALDAQFAAAATQAEKVSILRLGLRLSTLRNRIAELGGDPKQSSGRTSDTNTITTISTVTK